MWQNKASAFFVLPSATVIWHWTMNGSTVWELWHPTPCAKGPWEKGVLLPRKSTDRDTDLALAGPWNSLWTGLSSAPSPYHQPWSRSPWKTLSKTVTHRPESLWEVWAPRREVSARLWSPELWVWMHWERGRCSLTWRAPPCPQGDPAQGQERSHPAVSLRESESLWVTRGFPVHVGGCQRSSFLTPHIRSPETWTAWLGGRKRLRWPVAPLALKAHGSSWLHSRSLSWSCRGCLTCSAQHMLCCA